MNKDAPKGQNNHLGVEVMVGFSMGFEGRKGVKLDMIHSHYQFNVNDRSQEIPEIMKKESQYKLIHNSRATDDR